MASDTLKRFPTSRGDFYVPHYDLWSDRDEVARGAGVLRPGANVALLGSCIVRQAASYLERRGYKTFHSPGGYQYNVHAVRAELERVFEGKPWPVPVALEIPGSGSFVHPFRKNLVARSEDELVERDEQVSEQLASTLKAADVVICVVGTTAEAWRAGTGGAVVNEIPPPDVFNQGGWALDMGNLDDIRAEVRGTMAQLAKHTRAAQVYAVCPIPLYATWADSSIVAMNGRSKALLRAALEQELTEGETYLPMWDWMQAQTRRWSPTRSDGRHFDWVGVDRLMFFCERFLAAGEVPALSLRHRVSSVLKDAGYRLRVRGLT
jgi:hypothetical protein